MSAKNIFFLLDIVLDKKEALYKTAEYQPTSLKSWPVCICLAVSHKTHLVALSGDALLSPVTNRFVIVPILAVEGVLFEKIQNSRYICYFL